MSLSDLIDAVASRRDAYDQELSRIGRERGNYEGSASELEQQRERNGLEMAGYLLPDLDDEDLTALERRLRYPVLIAAKRTTEAELAALDRERAQIDADPRFAERAVQRVDYETQLAEIAEAATSFSAERAVWDASTQFRALLARGWFSDDYDGGLFDWLRDWRACSLLMEHLERGFPGRSFPDDDDVKKGWHTLYEASEPVLKLRRDLEQKLTDIAVLEQRHAELLAAPERLFQVLWKQLAHLIIDHLRAAPEDLLVKLASRDETLAVFLKKDAGLKKQAAYLRQLVVARIDPYAKQIEQEIQKLNTKVEKLRYKRARGKRVPASPAAINAFRSVPSAKWDARRASFEKTRDRVYGFDGWERGHFVEDFLWWDLVTRGARADDLYEVRVFHERHPGWSVTSFQDPLEHGAHHQVAAANDLAASADLDQLLADDNSVFDAS